MKRRRRLSRVAHPAGRTGDQLERTIARRIIDPSAVTAGEIESDVLALIAERYAGRHLDIETAQLGLANAAHKLIMAHLRAVAAMGKPSR